MKLVIGILIVVMSVVFVSAQDTLTPAAPAPAQAKVLAELSAARPASSMKNAPFSAEEVNESVQVLADGNRISRSWTGKIYRNSEGRVRRETNGGTGGVMGSAFTISGGGVSVFDPVIGQKFQLDREFKTARVAELKAGQEITIVTAPRAMEEDKAKFLARMGTEQELKTELRAIEPIKAVPGIMAVPPIVTTIAPMGAQGGRLAYSAGPTSKYETRSEDLGTRDFEGVSAEGSRKTTTIPAGAIGNERPIEISYERWFSRDLGMVVYSKNIDPRFGEQIYRMANIVRAEPDPSLFTVPSGYRKVNGGTAYRVTPSKTTEAERTAAAARAQTTFVRNKP